MIFWENLPFKPSIQISAEYNTRLTKIFPTYSYLYVLQERSNLMDMTQDFADANFIITGYEEDHVQINHEIYHQSVIISSNTLIYPWNVADASQLSESTLAPILKIRPEIMILGTGKSLVLPDPRIIALFAQQNIGIEPMNTSAACRTYGILITEGRKAAAGIIFA